MRCAYRDSRLMPHCIEYRVITMAEDSVRLRQVLSHNMPGSNARADASQRCWTASRGALSIRLSRVCRDAKVLETSAARDAIRRPRRVMTAAGTSMGCAPTPASTTGIRALRRTQYLNAATADGIASQAARRGVTGVGKRAMATQYHRLPSLGMNTPAPNTRSRAVTAAARRMR